MDTLAPDLGHILLALLLMAAILGNIILLRQTRPTVKHDTPAPPPPQPAMEPTKPDSPVAVEDQNRDRFDESNLVSFVRLHKDISDEIDFLEDSSEESDSLRGILDLLTQALNDCGVEQFSPSIGESYRTAHGVAPNPKLIKTSDDDQAWKIAKVIRPGFCIESPRQCCIAEAVVAVYKYEPAE